MTSGSPATPATALMRLPGGPMNRYGSAWNGSVWLACAWTGTVSPKDTHEASMRAIRPVKVILISLDISLVGRTRLRRPQLALPRTHRPRGPHKAQAQYGSLCDRGWTSFRLPQRGPRASACDPANDAKPAVRLQAKAWLKPAP